jgi:hypothetical protein
MEAKIEADRQRMDQMFQWMQSLGASMGQSPLPGLFALPPPPVEGTPVSMNVYCFCLCFTCI